MANLTDGIGLFTYHLQSNFFHQVISFHFIDIGSVHCTRLGNEPSLGLKKNQELKLMHQRLTLVVDGLVVYRLLARCPTTVVRWDYLGSNL